MKEKTNVRQVTLGDYKHIDSWYKKRNELRPISILLPNGGLDGFIVEKNKQPIGLQWVIVTTKIPALVKKGKELGFREDLICEEESRVIIYTYESKNKIFI